MDRGCTFMCRDQTAEFSSQDTVFNNTVWIVQSVLEVQHQTTTFDDQVAAPTIAPITRYRDLDVSDPTTSSELGDFLSRPVQIYNGSWTTAEGVGFKQALFPWADYLSNANIKYKLNNYGFIRGKLHVKVVINASPFYYGACLLNYTPMPLYHGRDSEAAGNMFYVPESQKPSFMIYPQECKGGEMVLPFYYNKNYLDLTSLEDITEFGQLDLIIYAPLRSANGAVGTGCSIQMYAWMEDVVLAGPTVKLAVQSQDEYGTGLVSAPASAVARFAAHLKKVPYIGQFATATEIGAKAISGMAQIFGFTNVPVIEPAQQVNVVAAPQIASSQIGHPMQKLAFDPKTELTVDNGAVGFSSEDELAIQNMVTRKSFLCKTTWTNATTVDTNLFSTLITPNMFDSIGQTNATRLAMTPMDMVQRMFRFWRGDIIFTFRIVASKYHKGRLRLAYDPVSSSVISTGDIGAMVQNTIYDLGHEEEEIEFRVPYSAAVSWLQCKTNITSKAWRVDGGALVKNNFFDNGVLTMKVLTILTAPVATSTVDILVFVRGAENMEFAAPAPIEGNFSQWAVQSQDERTPTTLSIEEEGGDCGGIISQRNRIYMGEQVRSLRHLLRRMSYVDRVYATPAVVGNTIGTMSRFPVSWGYNDYGIHKARNKANTADVSFNWVQTLPYHLMASCFLGQRGSFNWTFTGTVLSAVPFKVKRYTHPFSTADPMPWVTTAATASYTGNQALIQWSRGNDATGGALSNSNNCNALNIVSPDYSGHKFRSTEAIMGNFWSDDPASALEALQFEFPTVAGTNYSFDRYFGVGTDFNFTYFMYVPLWYVYNTVPLAPSV